MLRLLAATADWPLNVGLQACARAEDDGSLQALVDAGACGFKIHEDYGADPALIDHTLRFAEAHDLAVALHTDGLHESAELEDTVAAIDGRTIHAYHVEGSGGGHVPDAIGLVREPNVICSSTTPTIPWGIHAAAEQVPMIVLNHGASFGVAHDLELVRERVHETTMAAEGPLHELGAIAIVNSDSQGMGRMLETVRRTFQLAHVMRSWSGSVAAADGHDTARVLRYLAKVTIEPAITHGVAEHVGSLQPGRLADIVLWEPGYVGIKPALVLKGGMPAWGPLGEGNASVERAEPTRYRPEWAGLGRAAPAGSVTFVSAEAAASPAEGLRDHGRALVPVRGTRGLTRASLVHNRATAAIEVDVRDGTVTLDGQRLAVDPVAEVPLSRRYLLR
jgi:urease subunit alpha